MTFEKVTVIGLGYIGLPTAAMFASRKIKVHGVDVSQHVVDTVNQGKVHIVEPELDMIVQAAVVGGYLKASLTAEPSDAFLIAVPTPFKGDNHEPDLSYIESSCATIAPVLKKGDLIILESTSPVGTAEMISEWIGKLRSDLKMPKMGQEESDILIAYCPERVLPGHILRELVENDRVIGGINSRSSLAASELYKTFVMGECIVTNARTAEMVKLTENSFRDVNIAFANELSIICDKLGISVWELIRLANRHPRVNILQPGPGVGGHCIAVDPWFIVSQSPKEAKLIRTAREVNDGKPSWVIDKVKVALADFLQENPGKSVRDVSIACFGLAFKPDIDDLRESPALHIAKEISSVHAGKTFAVEPNITDFAAKAYGKLEFQGVEQALDKADIVVLLVDHKEFKKIPVDLLKGKKVVDTRGIWTQ
ncbi:UDP-N-acetyl-D-mannosamine dehydrogenase [Bdellovibrio bacteriovorus]|uniref:UDP-N-acetyl-D-mannosamine dehydrogenase n=1 Tax=Bdellovibrio bacteriovorus TaxID=959 RepID=UPI003A7FC574